MKKVKKVILLGLVFSLVLGFTNLIYAQNGKPDFPSANIKRIVKQKIHKKLESRVSRILETTKVKGKVTGESLAIQKGAKFKEGGLELEIYTKEGLTDIAIQKLKNIGVRVTGYYMHLVQIETPISLIPEIEKIEEINFISIPAYAQPKVVISEGVNVIGADVWHNKGLNGTGVKVGVLDSFQGYTSLLGTELPANVTTQDFGCSPPIEGSSNHGTAVAEIIYDIAPQASFYLTCIATKIDFGNAIDYLISQGVNVINASIGFGNSGEPCDAEGGGDVTCAAVKKARENEILYINASGNEGERHWGGVFKDDDGDDMHEWSGTDELNTVYLVAGVPILIILRWNDWPYSDQDYDLLLFDASLELVALSIVTQDGTQPPLEGIFYTPSSSGNYYIAIEKYDADVNVDFDLIIVGGYSLTDGYYTKSRSLALPSDSPFAFTVGAVGGTTVTPACDNDVLASYSSQGPTHDERIKPDVSAPTGVSTVTYEPRDCGTAGTGFEGTSSSTPHVAGISALVKQKFPSWTPSQIQTYIENHAIELGVAGKDNGYGWGRIQLDVTSPGAITNVTLADTPSDNGGSLTVGWDANADSDFDHYNIYISTTAITDVTAMTAEKTISNQSTTTTTITTISGVAITDGVDYYVAVTAVDTVGNENKTDITDAGPTKSGTTVTTLLPSGTSVVSVPINAGGKDPKDMFGISAEELEGNLARWKPDESKYCYYPDDFVKEIELGEGFWLKLTAGKTVSVNGILQATELQISLLAGWNQIGNPFNFSIAWDDNEIKVENTTTGVKKSLHDAAIEDWVCIYAWAYTADGYQLVHPDIPDALSNLEPWAGYWVKANIGCKLIVPSTQAKAKKEAPLEEISENNWRLQLIAEVEGVRDTFNFLGVSANKIRIGEPPPPILPSISLYFLEGKERYAFSYRQPSEAKAWDFAVETALSDKEITLSWDLSSVPQGYKFVLYDIEKDKEIAMSLSNSYRYNSQEGEEKHFQIRVKDKSLLANVQKVFNYPNPFSGDTTIRVELDNTATVSAEIYTISGEKIKTIPMFGDKGIQSGNQVYEAVWNGITDRGERVANGVYIYVVKIRDNAGNEKRVTKKMAVIK